MIDIENLFQRLKSAKNNIEYLNNNLNQMSDHEIHFQNQHSNATKEREEIERIHHLVIGYFQSSLDEMRVAISIAEAHINEVNRDNSDSNGSQLPSADEVKEMLEKFLHDKIKTRSPPIPNFCGCYAYKQKPPKEGSFICARIFAGSENSDPHYYLYIVQKNENGLCYAFDPKADDLDKEIKIVELKDENLTPLPTIIPERPIKRWEHAKKSKVLSLFHEDNEWTTEFYFATVEMQPCERMDAEVRGYELDFGDDTVYVVPEKFVVAVPDSWNK